MRPAPRAWILWGGLSLLALGLLYLAGRQQSAPRPPARRAASSPASADPTQDATPLQAEARGTPSPKPDPSQGPAPEAIPAFEKPASAELYWQELERLERGDRERALSYALAGDDWYPDVGRPAEARRAKVVTLLVELHRMKAAREQAQSFIEKYPASPYRRLVQGVTGIHPRPGRPPTPERIDTR